MKFVSTASILLRSGKGGDGLIAWRRESHVRLGGPAGGSGGKGGSIYLEADENLNSLFHVRHIKFLKAKDGENGKNKSKNGRDAEDLVLKVPCGTQIINKKTGEKIVDLIFNKEKYLICKGGFGGRGNVAFKSSRNPSPYLYEFGDPSEEKEIFLDLMFISDVGLLGKPNAGKSSLLGKVSNAKPKVAEFPFTTLIPVLGSVEYKNKKIIFADIPGLIENASKGAGLGIEFLKHLNRCKVLIHMVDVSSENVIKDIYEIENEIKNYSLDLFNKPRLLVLNKIDLVSDKYLINLEKDIEEKINIKPIFISVFEYKNIDFLLEKIFNLYFLNFENLHTKKLCIPDYLEIKDDENLFFELQIDKKGDKWIVIHPVLKYWVNKIPKDTSDNIYRLFSKLDGLGVNKKLEELGAKKNDLVDVYGWTYEY